MLLTSNIKKRFLCKKYFGGNMAAKKTPGFDSMRGKDLDAIDKIGVVVAQKKKVPKKVGRPRKTTYDPEDFIKLTTRVDPTLHKQLQLAAVAEGIPMAEITADALKLYLKDYATMAKRLLSKTSSESTDDI